VIDLQSPHYVGTTGDPALDAHVRRWLAMRAAWHRTAEQLREAS
jgi:anti-sigma factor RsiW